MRNFGIVLAIAAAQSLGLRGRNVADAAQMAGRQGSIFIDEYAGLDRRLPNRRARSPRLGRRQRNFGIVHIVSIKPEAKRARRRRRGREKGTRRLAYAQHLARCGK